MTLVRALPFVQRQPALLAGIDLAALVARLDAELHLHGARRQSAPFDLVLRPGIFRSIASVVVESDRIARATVSQIRVAPFLGGIAMVVHPRPEIDAPMLVADVMVPPSGSARSFIDTCGPAIARDSFEGRFRAPLAAILDGAHVARRTTVPPWIAALSGGAGARLQAGRGGGGAIGAVLVAYVRRYLEALGRAEEARDVAGNRAAARAVREAVMRHGPAGRHLRRAFGGEFAGRYLRLLWGEG
jgi:hypothetical protein